MLASLIKRARIKRAWIKRARGQRSLCWLCVVVATWLTAVTWLDWGLVLS